MGVPGFRCLAVALIAVVAMADHCPGLDGGGMVIVSDDGGAGTDPAERWLLVAFHDSDAASTFGTQFPTWNTVLRDAANTAYVDPDGNPDHKGIADHGTSPGDDVTYYGVRGTIPIDMRSPQRIVATFYNNSGSSKTFQARVSFKDPDGALGATWEQPWYQMYGAGITAASGGITLAGYSTGELYLNIADAMHVDAPLAPPTSGTNSLVNITLSKFDPDVVLTKIELSHEQDVTPPTMPGNLSARAITPSAEAGNCVVELTWTPSADLGEGVSRYHVYRDAGSGWVLHEMVDKAWTEFFGTNVVVYRDYQVQPNTQYAYGVEALDAEINGTYLAPGSIAGSRRGNVSARATTTITTPAFSMPTLIDATSDLIYLGRFRVPSNGNWDGIGMGLSFNPNGNPSYDPNTELPGSLLITGRQDELTIGEFTIAKPTLTDNIQAMHQARLLQPFVALFNWTPSGGNAIWHFCGYHPGGNGVGPHIYGSQYRFYASPLDQAHLCAFDMDLTQCWGPWHIGSASAPDKIDFRYSGKFIFAAPQDWADTHVGGRSLIVGNGGAVSGYGLPTAGPSLYALAPWESGAFPTPSGVVSAVELVRYGTHTDSLSTWHDNWGSLTRTHGACWAMGGGKQAVIVSGVIARGDTWYGGSDGSESTTSSYDEPRTLNGTKGYHATLREASLMLFNPADLARVAQGAMAADQPRNYQTLNVQKHFLLNRDVAEIENVSIACDQANGYIYVHEKDGETSTRSLMHVWKIGTAAANNEAPTVDAGPDQTVTSSASASLDGTVSDDGLPAAPAIVYAWTKESGPGTVTFGDAMLVDTTASFGQGGVYVLRLTATDGLGLAGSDTVTITVLGSVSYAAQASGRFNLESTWTPAGGPPRAGDIASIGGGFAVNTLSAGEVPAGVTVNLQAGGTLRLTDPGTSAIAPVDTNAIVNVAAGGTLEIQSENSVVGTINLNGGTIVHNIATGGTGNIAAGATLNINSDSFLSPIGAALVRINCPVHGAGKLTLTADAANANNGIAFATASTWSGAWDFQGYMRFGDGTGFKQRWVPGDVRVAAGKTVYCVGNARTIKGTRSGSGMDRLYLDSTTTIGDGTGNGVLSPGDGAGGVGTVAFQAFNGAGNASHTLKFNAGSTYVVDINGVTSNTCDVASSIGIGTGTGNVQVVAGAKLTVTLWTPATNAVLDATVIDGTGTKLDAADFAVTWNQTGGWSDLVTAWVGADLHVTGRYTATGGGDSNGNGIPDAWELHYFGNLTHSMSDDADGDGLNNHGEWVAGTDPTNAFSRLMLFDPKQAAGAGMVTRWSSESNRFYTLKLSTNLTLDPFTATLTNRMPATPPVNVHTDTVERSGNVFYRIAVQNQ